MTNINTESNETTKKKKKESNEMENQRNLKPDFKIK